MSKKRHYMANVNHKLSILKDLMQLKKHTVQSSVKKKTIQDF